MIKTIIFDYDGVIVDSFSNVYEVYRIICEKLEKPFPENLEDFRKLYGESSAECYNQLGFSEEDKGKANVIFKEEIMKQNPAIFEGIKETIEKLSKDYTLTVASSSYRDEVIKKLKKYDLLKNFKYVLGREQYVSVFNKVGLIKETIEKENLDPSEVLLIGDRNVDFLDGSKAGLSKILLVEYGWGYDIKQIPEHKQEIVVKSPKDLLDAIEEMNV